MFFSASSYFIECPYSSLLVGLLMGDSGGGVGDCGWEGLYVESEDK